MNNRYLSTLQFRDYPSKSSKISGTSYKITTILFLILVTFKLSSQVIFGQFKYSEYHQGNLPIVISVPHGGTLKPTEIPDRTCNNPTTVTDSKTIELGLQIDSALVKLSGCHAHLVICNLNRIKLDCNRNLEDGACGNSRAENAWNEFYNFIEAAQSASLKQFNGKSFYFDLHGHGNPIQRLELGYLLSAKELALSDSILNTKKYIGFSSIQNLVTSNANNYTHAQLLRGQHALGTLIGLAGFPAVPSRQIPFPELGDGYFSGGYNTANHTGYIEGNKVNGLQIECNFNNVRDTYLNRKRFADSLASVLLRYLQIHEQMDFSSCKLLLAKDDMLQKGLNIFPNPNSDLLQVTIWSEIIGSNYQIFDTAGQLRLQGRIGAEQLQINTESLSSGIYFLVLDQKIKQKFIILNN
ncbi:MAG: T9SS type A sorting domain-containing protein [Saprospiraceae bacterium]